MAKETWIPPRFKNQLHCGIVAGGRGVESSSQPGLDLVTVAPNCHGKTKNLTAKPKTSRQKQNTLRQNRKPHGKNKNLTAKTKYLTTKPKTSRQNQRRWKTSRQNQILHSKNQIPHGKSKYPLQNQSYFAFAVKYLILSWGILLLPWGFCFCRDSCGPP